MERTLSIGSSSSSTGDELHSYFHIFFKKKERYEHSKHTNIFLNHKLTRTPRLLRPLDCVLDRVLKEEFNLIKDEQLSFQRREA